MHFYAQLKTKNFRFWHKADVQQAKVRYEREADIDRTFPMLAFYVFLRLAI